MDYKELLKKYMDYVWTVDGSNFLYRIDLFPEIGINDEEKKALKEIEKELIDESN